MGDNIIMGALLAMLLFLFSCEAHGLSKYMLGGYAAFPLSMQEASDGSVNPYALAPSLAVGTTTNLEEITNSFAPTFGIVFHGSGAGEDYSKHTLYFLADLEMDWGAGYYFRYGLGLFATLLDGEGGPVRRKNGDEEVDFYRPAKSAISYNMALDLGWEYRFTKHWFVRIQGFVFSIWDDKSRSLSYMLTLGYMHPNLGSLW